MRTLTLALFVLLLVVPARADEPAFEHVQLVLLLRGPQADTIPAEELEDLQRQHIQHLTRLGDQGLILVAGPFDQQQDESFRGMCLYRASSLEEARRLASEDPAVKAGRLRVEAMDWWYERGRLEFPKEKD